MERNEFTAHVGLAEAATDEAIKRVRNTVAVQKRQAERNRTSPAVAAVMLLLAAGAGFLLGTIAAGALLS